MARGHFENRNTANTEAPEIRFESAADQFSEYTYYMSSFFKSFVRSLNKGLKIRGGIILEFFEQFKILLLNRAYKVLGIYEISSGGITGTVVDIRLIFSAARKANATSIMMIHNHPSGRTIASEADKNITGNVHEAGKLLDIVLLDHLIITPDFYYSFADDDAL